MMTIIQPNVLIQNHPLPQNRRNMTHVFVGRASTLLIQPVPIQAYAAAREWM